MANYLERIAGEWQERSSELADWVMTHLVNRTDVWGRYACRAIGHGTPPQVRSVAYRPKVTAYG
jgi:hypothetical protein